jgi:hypothetical protein
VHAGGPNDASFSPQVCFCLLSFVLCTNNTFSFFMILTTYHQLMTRATAHRVVALLCHWEQGVPLPLPGPPHLVIFSPHCCEPLFMGWVPYFAPVAHPPPQATAHGVVDPQPGPLLDDTHARKQLCGVDQQAQGGPLLLPGHLAATAAPHVPQQHCGEQLLTGWMPHPAPTSTPVLRGTHNCGYSQVQELFKMGGGGSTHTCHDPWVTGMGWHRYGYGYTQKYPRVTHANPYQIYILIDLRALQMSLNPP